MILAVVGRRLGRPVAAGEVAEVAARLGLGEPVTWTSEVIERVVTALHHGGDA